MHKYYRYLVFGHHHHHHHHHFFVSILLTTLEQLKSFKVQVTSFLLVVCQNRILKGGFSVHMYLADMCPKMYNGSPLLHQIYYERQAM
jgi:hypothetical protein